MLSRLGCFSEGCHGDAMDMDGDNLNPCEIIDLTDWVNLENSGGSAFPDTPAKLRDLASGDFSAVTSALDHLYGALLNDGVVYSATAPAFRYVAALLGDRSSRVALTPPWEEGNFPLRGKLLTWLASVAFDVSVGRERYVREWGNYSSTEPFPDFIEIRNAYPEAFLSVVSYFDDSDPRVVEAALVAAVRFLESPALAVHSEELAPLVESILVQSSNEWYRNLASEALSAWRQGRILMESYTDLLPFEGGGGVYGSQENRESISEPPF